MARYDEDGYRETIQGVRGNAKQIKGYSREEKGGADQARARSDFRRDSQRTTALPDRSIGAQMGQFRNPNGSIRADRGVTVPSYGGGTKSVMPVAKVTPREKLPATIRRPDDQTEGMEQAQETVETIAPRKDYTGMLNKMFDDLRSPKRRTKVMRPTE